MSKEEGRRRTPRWHRGKGTRRPQAAAAAAIHRFQHRFQHRYSHGAPGHDRDRQDGAISKSGLVYFKKATEEHTAFAQTLVGDFEYVLPVFHGVS